MTWTTSTARLVKEAGLRVVISTDAHHASQLGNLRYGVWVARRGWLERDDVLNTLPLTRLKGELGRKRRCVGADRSSR